MVIVDNVVLMEDSSITQLSFTTYGDPPVQQRPKIVYRNRRFPDYYDPSGPAKKAYSAALSAALLEAGITGLPVYQSTPTTGKGVELLIIFYFKRPRIDYRFN